MCGLFQNNVVSGSILRLSVRVIECYLFQDLTIERKNACFIAQRCLNRYKIDKFCTIERRMEDVFAQLNNYWRRPFGRHSELVLTKCFVRGLFRNGQGAAELAFGSNTAALFLPIFSSPLYLTPQSVRTQFRVAFGVAFFFSFIFGDAERSGALMWQSVV